MSNNCYASHHWHWPRDSLSTWQTSGTWRTGSPMAVSSPGSSWGSPPATWSPRRLLPDRIPTPGGCGGGCKSSWLKYNIFREDWHAYDPFLISEGLFGAGMISSYLKIVQILSVNPHLGPLQISLGRMIMDIMKWICLGEWSENRRMTIKITLVTPRRHIMMERSN